MARSSSSGNVDDPRRVFLIAKDILGTSALGGWETLSAGVAFSNTES